MRNTLQWKYDSTLKVEKVRTGRISSLIISRKDKQGKGPGVLWIHGGGYITGMKEMAFIGRAVDLVKKFDITVVSPGYRLAWIAPYPAALDDCYQALLYMKEHCEQLGVRSDQIMVGGESAGGGLAAALCLLARDRKEVRIAYQMPLYPMLDNFDTETSAANHGRVWNTFRNHIGWKMYLRKDAGQPVSPYASVARAKDYSDLPPAYTFVGDQEPFYSETRTYIENLKKAGIWARMDIYHTNMHAFDILRPKDGISEKAVQKFEEEFAYAMNHYFSAQVK